MFRRAALAVAVVVGIALVAPGTEAIVGATAGSFAPGAPGAGDPYYPLDGNGGYDVRHYLLDVSYAPDTDVLTGVATITARATQELSSFNLDLTGLTVRSVLVNGQPAGFSRAGQELTVRPRTNLATGAAITTVVRYDGVPEPLPEFGASGFFPTDDGAVIVGEPHVAATWFPVNDHPSDKATYTFKVTVPAGLEVVANGLLESKRTAGGRTTWTWQEDKPMASYLATSTMGEFNLRNYSANGVKFTDALDPDLFDTSAPRTGQRFAIAGQADNSYKRLSRTISVPAGGADMSFWVHRLTEADFDYAFVEARTVGADDWTTLPDRNGHTSGDTGFSCPGWHGDHPFLTHYQTGNADDTCAPTGTTGTWNAASGDSAGYEQWSVDLSGYAGRDVEVSISYASDGGVQLPGLFVDDIVVSTGAGTTSFEEDGDVLDGWTVPGAPPGTEPNSNDWITGTPADAPPSDGAQIEAVLARQPEILTFLSSKFGPYPYSTCGAIVDDNAEFGTALENQTRPIYNRGFLAGDPIFGTETVVHELAHQWFGDSVSVAKWQHIWLNEGFATYAEWLWDEREGLGTVQETFDFFYNRVPPQPDWWKVVIGDPGVANLFRGPVYIRGGMTLHQLRLAVGDTAFFQTLRQWAATRVDGNGTTPEFIALAEQISGRDLDELFDTWLFTAKKPVLDGVAATTPARPPAGALGLEIRLSKDRHR